jgi:DNA-directed RNA polymerase subunit RPC12/RpoP
MRFKDLISETKKERISQPVIVDTLKCSNCTFETSSEEATEGDTCIECQKGHLVKVESEDE